MSNLLVVNPPFKFEGSLKELNEKFKLVERFEVIYHSESLSRSTNYCFNIIGSICGFISSRNHSDAMMERYAIIEEALRESLRQHKLKVDGIEKNIKENISRSLELFRKEVERILEKMKSEYRVIREKIKEKLEKLKMINKIREELKVLYLEVKEIIKVTLDTFKEKFSNNSEYTRLNDEYLEMEKRYVNLIKLEVR